MDFIKLSLVGIGGLLGSVARYVTAKSIDVRVASAFPYGTLTVNLLGSLVLGVIYGTLLRKTGGSEHWRLFLGTGFCGGFTTFSTFALENVTLFQQKLEVLSLLYIAVSLLFGLGCTVFGIWLSRFL